MDTNVTLKLDWPAVRVLVREMEAKINATLARPVGAHNIRRIRVYGVPRGGAIVAGLMDTARFEVVDKPLLADVVVDDLVDSGATAAKYKDFKGHQFFVLLDKKTDSAYMGKWISFPWEGEAVADNEDHVRRIIELCGDDPSREGMAETPARYLKAMRELTRGYREDPVAHLHKSFDIQDHGGKAYDQIIGSIGIPFVSLCEHHMLPFFGEAHLGYIPQAGGRVVGLSKLARLVDGYAARFQVQERLTQQIHDAMVSALSTDSAMVIIKSTHTCQCWRGVKKNGKMVTSAVSGSFVNTSTKEEFMALIAME